ncbi:MAG: WG repeat-containing protein [Flavobacteriales bacterium]|nr:WG repeat-containing protein [Flavobacteriales bacterium]
MIRAHSHRLLLASFMLVLPGWLMAGKLENAFQALAVHDYFKARQLFLGQVAKHPAAAWYGLSVITGRADNPFYQLDSAYALVLRSEIAFDVAPPKERERIGRVGVDANAIREQKERLHQAAWELAKQENSIDAYDAFLSIHHTSAQAEEARLIRDHMAFQLAREGDRSTDYRTFLDRYPDAKQVYEARSRLQEALFRESTSNGTVEEFERFVRDNPESAYVEEAEDAIYRLSTPHRTTSEIAAFIKGHPTNHNVPDAWRVLYELYTKQLSADAITRFLKEHPEYPFMEELMADYNTASLVLHPFRHQGKWGYIDGDGLERIKAIYDWVEPFRGGQALVGIGDRVGTINKSGKEVIDVQYDEVQELVEGLATVERSGKVGVVDHNGDIAIEMVYAEIGEFSDGRAYAAKEGKYGFLNARGGVVIPFQYDLASSFHKGLAVVEKDGASGVVDTNGELVVPFQYDWIEGFANDVSRVRKDGRFGIIGPFGDELLPAVHKAVGAIGDMPILVVRGDSCGYLNKQGQWVIPVRFEAAEGVMGWGEFRNGAAKVQLKGKRGLIDTTGRFIVPAENVDVGGVGRLIPVKKKTKWGYIDREKRPVVEARYEQAWDLIDGYARVRSAKGMGCIDSTGKEVIPATYSSISDARHGLFVASAPEGTGVLDAQGQVVLSFSYDAVEIEDADVLRVERNELLAYYRISKGRFFWKEEGFDAPGSAQ